MFERFASAPRGCLAVALLTLLASCATAEEARLLDTSELPASGAGGVAGSTTRTGSPAAGNAAGGMAGMARAGASGRDGSAGANGNGGSPAGSRAGAPGASGSSSTAGRAGASAGSAGTGSGAGAGALLLSDDFEDGTPDGWISAGGTWAIVADGSKVYAQQAAGTGSKLLLSAGGSTTWTDQIVEAKVKVTAFGGQSSSYFAAIYARFSTAGYYALTLRSDGKIAIRSGNSTIGSAVAAGISVGTWYTVRLEAVGTTLKAYVDGVLKDTETDSSIAAGGIAVSAVNALAEFDDVKVSLP